MALSKSQSPSSLSSIEQLVSTLGDQLDLTGEQIADVLWLTLELQKYETNSDEEIPNLQDANSDILPKTFNQATDESQVTEPITPTASKSKEESSIRKTSEKQGSVYANSGSGGIQGLSIGVPDAPSLREPLKLAQALRPLMRQVATGKRLILDEAATVQRIAEERIFMPVLKAEPELWLDLALVIDESHSMLIWGHTIQELKEIFKKYGIFRDIRIWGLQPDETGNSLQIFSRMGSSKRLTDPKEIVDPTGRRLILIVSDCVSNIWRKGMMFPVLKMWTEKQPLTILQMLPEWMWRRTALDLGTAVGFKSSMMGVANQQLSLHKPLRRSRSIGFKVEDRSKIPVITLDWDKAAQWSQMLIGKADALVPGYLLPSELEIEEDISSSFLEKEDSTVSDLDAAEIVKRFRMTTSPLGRELAGLLAASPVINLPVVRLIQESLLPKSNQVQVAEVFLGGLLRPQSVSLEKLQSQESESKTILSPDSVEYEFIQPEIRDIFLDDAPISDSIDVVNAVSRYVAEQLGVSLSEFMAVLKAPQQVEEKQQEDIIKPFAQITARVLRKLGGQYVQFAEELEQPVDKIISNTSEQKEIEQDISLSDELRTAMTIADEQEQAEVLSHLMARSPEAPSNLLNSLSTIEDETDRVSALIALVAHLPHSLLPNALEIVRNLQHTFSRFQGLAILATLLPEVVPEALQAALNITNESTLLRALTSLVEKLPVELLPQALQASLTIDDAFSRTRALIALVDKLPEAAPQALEAILSIESEDSRACALRELVPHLPVNFLPYALEVVMAIQQENVRNDLLKDLRSFLPENLWHQSNVAAATPSRTPLWQEGDTQIYTLCTSTPWDLPLDVLVIPVGNRGGLGNFAVAFQEFLGIKPKWLTQVISNAIEAKELKRIKPDRPLLVQIPFEINSQISSLVGFTSERFIICATSESENELSSNNTSIAYEAVVRLAVEQGFKRIVLPLIGTGVNRLPVDEVVEGMLRAINNVFKFHRSTSLEEITIVDRSADKIEIIDRIADRLNLSATEASPERQTILFLGVPPRETSSLVIDLEFRNLVEGLRRAQTRDRFNLERRWAVRPIDLRRAMLELEPQIIHFSGHGTDEAGLTFEDEIGNSQLVDSKALTSLFKVFADRVKCVLLNGCYSEVQARAIAQHIPCVIGINKEVGDKVALNFAVGFYDALGAGKDVEFAYKLACNSIQMEGISEHLTPILLTKNNITKPKNTITSQRVFISYRSQEPDVSLAQEFHDRLQAAGHTAFMAAKSISWGENWIERIDQELKQCDYFLLLLSEQFASSDMVAGEVRTARGLRDKVGKPIILPIRVNLPIDDPLNYELRSVLQTIQQKSWRSPDDTPVLVQEILSLMAAGAAPEPVTVEIPVVATIEAKNRPPLPVADLELPGGAMSLESKFYVEREPWDERCCQEIERKAGLIRIKAPRQMGKTSLLTRIRNHATKQGYRAIVLDFLETDEATFASSSIFLKRFCALVSRQLGISPRKVTEFWDEDLFGAKENCSDYIEQYVLADLTGPLFLGIDELDRLFPYDQVAKEFLMLLRAWNEKAKINETWSKLRIAIAHSTESYVVMDTNSSPFNLGLAVDLAEFTSSQVLDLATRHGLNWETEEVEQLMAMVGGHPYLVRLSLYRIAQGDLTLAELLAEAPTDTGLFGEHLRRHFWNLQQHPELAQAFHQVIFSDRPVILKPMLAFKLNGMGLVDLKGNEVTPRYDRLYRPYFRSHLSLSPS
jgi:serine/threonine-protein kinase